MADIDIDLPVNRISEDKLKIIANIDDFDLSALTHYVKILTKGKITDISGIINLKANTKDDKFGHKNIETALTLKNLKICGKDEVSKIESAKDIIAQINFGTIENGINFKLKIQ